MKFKLLTLLFISILLVGTVSSIEWDNVKRDIDYSKDSTILIGDKEITYREIWEKYAPIEIKNAFGLGETLWEGAIDEHTEICGTACSSTIDISLTNDGTLIDDVEFYTIKDDGRRIKQDIINYQFYVATSERHNIVQDYEWTCEYTGFIYKNSTNERVCSNNNIGSHIEIEYTWEEYNIGEDVIAGEYKVKLEGEKQQDTTVDWIIKTHGEWINDWAEWSVEVFTLDDHGLNLSISNTDANYRGPGILALKNITLVNVTRAVDVTHFNVRLLNESQSIIQQAPFVNGVATFNANLTENIRYFLVAGSNGSSETSKFIGSVPFNITGTNINWTEGLNGAAPELTLMMNIQSIFTSVPESGITLNSPADNFISSDSVVDFNCSIVHSVSATNISLFTDQSGVFELVNTSVVSGLVNESVFSHNLGSVGTFSWTCEACDTDDDCAFAGENRTINIISFSQNSVLANSTTRETASETFTLNISSGSTEIESAIFFYDDVNKGTSTFTGNSSDAIFSNTIDIPTITTIGNRSFFWEVTTASGQQNTTSNNIFVNKTILDLCNTTNNIPYINFTFRNETTNEEALSASLSSGDFNYYLGGGTVNKTLFFSNSTVNPSYAFCLSPGVAPITLGYSFAFTNPESQTRLTQDIITVSNMTTEKVLYLLPTALGLFTTFSVQNNLGSPISGVSAIITRGLGASIITVGTAITDSSGIVTFFLNPDVIHTGTFSKIGLPTNTFTFFPITETRVVIMGTTTSVNASNISLGTEYTILPSNITLLNNTDFTFSFFVNTSNEFNFISMNITNISNDQLAFESSTSLTTVSTLLNTGNNTRLIGTFIFTSGDETVTFIKTWNVGNFFEGDYSLSKQLRLYLDYGFNNIYRFLIVIISIIAVLIFMTTGETLDTSESKVAVATLMVWVWSIVGWLDTGVIINSVNSNVSTLTQFSNQFGIAILSTAIGIFFIMRRIFQ